MARGQSGKQLVALAITGTITAIGVGTIYLPFVADRDKLRGLFEEGEESIPEGARREIHAIRRKEEAERAAEKERHQVEAVQQQQQHKSAGSMWSSFRRNQ